MSFADRKDLNLGFKNLVIPTSAVGVQATEKTSDQIVQDASNGNYNAVFGMTVNGKEILVVDKSVDNQAFNSNRIRTNGGARFEVWVKGENGQFIQTNLRLNSSSGVADGENYFVFLNKENKPEFRLAYNGGKVTATQFSSEGPTEIAITEAYRKQ